MRLSVPSSPNCPKSSNFTRRWRLLPGFWLLRLKVGGPRVHFQDRLAGNVVPCPQLPCLSHCEGTAQPPRAQSVRQGTRNVLSRAPRAVGLCQQALVSWGPGPQAPSLWEEGPGLLVRPRV